MAVLTNFPFLSIVTNYGLFNEPSGNPPRKNRNYMNCGATRKKEAAALEMRASILKYLLSSK